MSTTAEQLLMFTVPREPQIPIDPRLDALLAAGWDESQHPRDAHGRFGDADGKDTKPAPPVPAGLEGRVAHGTPQARPEGALGTRTERDSTPEETAAYGMPYSVGVEGSPAEPPYYHGSTQQLQPGDTLQPGSESGMKGVISELKLGEGQTPDMLPATDQVYLSNRSAFAASYAASVAGHDGGDMHVYEVEARGPVAPDPEFTDSGLGSDQVVVPEARVLREVPWEEYASGLGARRVDHWDWLAAGKPDRFGLGASGWDESQHPRDAHGRFGDTDGGSNAPGTPDGSGPETTAVYTAEGAVRRTLGPGEHLPDPPGPDATQDGPLSPRETWQAQLNMRATNLMREAQGKEPHATLLDYIRSTDPAITVEYANRPSSPDDPHSSAYGHVSEPGVGFPLPHIWLADNMHDEMTLIHEATHASFGGPGNVHDGPFRDRYLGLLDAHMPEQAAAMREHLREQGLTASIAADERIVKQLRDHAASLGEPTAARDEHLDDGSTIGSDLLTWLRDIAHRNTQKITAAGWEEDAHPRDAHGRFGPKDGDTETATPAVSAKSIADKMDEAVIAREGGPLHPDDVGYEFWQTWQILNDPDVGLNLEGRMDHVLTAELYHDIPDFRTLFNDDGSPSPNFFDTQLRDEVKAEIDKKIDYWRGVDWKDDPLEPDAPLSYMNDKAGLWGDVKDAFNLYERAVEAVVAEQRVTAAGDFDEAKHPRGEGGKFDQVERESMPATKTAENAKTEATLRLATYGKVGLADLQAGLLRDAPPGTTVDLEAHHIGGGVALAGSYHDEHGVRIGGFSREFFISDRWAVFTGMKLDPEVQGQGIGRAHYAAMVDLAQKMGCDRVSLDANISVGGYAWARCGFVPGDGTQVERFLSQPPVHDRWAEASDELKREFVLVRDEGLRHLAEHGTGYETVRDVMYGVSDSPAGKLILLGTNWNGTLNLTDPVAVDRFNTYTHAHVQVAESREQEKVRQGGLAAAATPAPAFEAEPVDTDGNDAWIWAEILDDDTLTAAGVFDEDAHPRGHGGKFVDKGEPGTEQLGSGIFGGMTSRQLAEALMNAPSHGNTTSLIEPLTGEPLTNTEVGETTERLLAVKLHDELAAVFGPGRSSLMEGERRAPFDWMSGTHGVEIKTTNAEANAGKPRVGMKEYEREGKLAEAERLGKDPVLMTVVLHPNDEGVPTRATVTYTDGIENRYAMAGMRLGSFAISPREWALASLDVKHAFGDV